MAIGHMTLVWYRKKWQIAQYGTHGGFPTSHGKRLVDFVTNNRQRNSDFAAIHPPPKLKKLNVNKIKALKTALNEGGTYVATPEERTEIFREAQRIQDEARTLCWNEEYLDGLGEEDLANVLEKDQVERATRQFAYLIQTSLSPHCGAYILDCVAFSDSPVPLRMSFENVVDADDVRWIYVIDLDAENSKSILIMRTSIVQASQEDLTMILSYHSQVFRIGDLGLRRCAASMH